MIALRDRDKQRVILFAANSVPDNALIARQTPVLPRAQRHRRRGLRRDFDDIGRPALAAFAHLPSIPPRNPSGNGPNQSRNVPINRPSSNAPNPFPNPPRYNSPYNPGSNTPTIFPITLRTALFPSRRAMCDFSANTSSTTIATQTKDTMRGRSVAEARTR